MYSRMSPKCLVVVVVITCIIVVVGQLVVALTGHCERLITVLTRQSVILAASCAPFKKANHGTEKGQMGQLR